MRFGLLIYCLLNAALGLSSSQIPLLRHLPNDRAVSPQLFRELEELARIVDIAYCVGLPNPGISKPFSCLSRCSEFPSFELVHAWNTGPLMSDSCGYLALDHSPQRPRIILAFRGTYSIANAVVDLSTVPQEYVPYPAGPGGSTPKCNNCTVHTGFYESWRVTSKTINSELEALVTSYPGYRLHLVGHSLGGAVAALGGLEYLSRGWHPTVTTFGEPRIGNKAFTGYIDTMFALNVSLIPPSDHASLRYYEQNLAFRRVTHVDDPVPHLPLTEWGFRMHAGEIHISKQQLSPDLQDIQHCFGDEDPTCIAGQDSTLAPSLEQFTSVEGQDARTLPLETIAETVKQASLWGTSGGRITIPARYKLWQMLFAHRDYFWRLGLCVPGGTPWGWGHHPDGSAGDSGAYKT